MMTMTILVTVSGFLGVLITILTIFIDIKPSKRKISRKDMTFLIVWLGLMILGFVNLYYIYDNGVEHGDQNNSAHTNDNDYFDFVDEEVLIEQNFELIQKLKEEYSNVDTEVISNDSINILIYEKAGYVFQNLLKTEKCDILAGNKISPYKVIILDYLSDDIIYAYTPETNKIEFYPDNYNKFYCVVFNENYDIYVTHPIQISGGEGYNDIKICLNKKKSTYTSLFQLHLFVRDIKLENSYSKVSNEYNIFYFIRNVYSGTASMGHKIQMNDSGILSYGRYSYFSLNTDYVIDMDLYHQSDDKLRLAQQSFDGSVIDSNIVEIYFDLE